MEFYTSSKKKRPKRLSEKTRMFAYDSLQHKYGLDTLKTLYVSMDNTENYEIMTETEKYNAAVYEIASKSPIRICDGELLSGAATLGNAIKHKLPISYKNEEPGPESGISHLTADFGEVLKIGMNGIRAKIVESLQRHSKGNKREFLESCLYCIDCMKLWRDRYIDALAQKEGYDKIIANLLNVPFEPAKNFYEAVQSIWFCFAFLRLNGIWPGIGRIDLLLGEYLKNDLKNEKLTIYQAREILAHFFIKGCEWINGLETFGGDAQHYQNIVLSGIDESGNEVTNEVTYLVLDIIEETGISDFPVTVRINKNSDPNLIKRIAQVIQYGGGIVAVYNEDLILDSLTDMGYSEKEARNFANDGCWEVQIPGKTNFSYIPFDALKILQCITLDSYNDFVCFENFETLYCKYISDLKEQVNSIFKNHVSELFVDNNFRYKSRYPCALVSLFEHPCIEKGLSYAEGGTAYTVISPHIGGTADVVNSLYAIKKIVFDEHKISFREFMKILHNNWNGEDKLRKYMQENFEYYGNDNDEVDSIAVRLLDDFSDICIEYDKQTPVRFVSGVSTFGRQIEWAPFRYATPFGRKKGEVLSGNLSPTPGTDRDGISAIIKSYCKINLKKQYTGAALDISFIPSDTDTENSTDAIAGFIKAFIYLGGYFMQIDTVSKQILIDAQKNPENYPNLSVRVSGWNARFVTMSKEWQDMIIERTV